MKYLILLAFIVINSQSIAQKNKRQIRDSIRGSIFDINPNGDGFTN